MEQSQPGPCKWMGPLLVQAHAIGWPPSFPMRLDEQHRCAILSIMRNSEVVTSCLDLYKRPGLSSEAKLEYVTQQWASCVIMALYAQVIEWADQHDILRISSTGHLHWRAALRSASSQNKRMRLLRIAIRESAGMPLAALRAWLRHGLELSPGAQSRW